MEPKIPTTSASPSTDALTWRREAPSARSRASSRLRWATRIEKVFTIRNVPTTMATAANTSRKVLMKPRYFPMALLVSSAHASPVRTTTPGGTTAAAASRSSVWDTPSAVVSEMLV